MSPRSPKRRRRFPPGARTLTLAFALGGGGLEGQGREAVETIASDRPGIGNGAYAMAEGELQVEAGIEFTGSGGADILRIGQGLVRYGLPGLELRLGLNSFALRREDSSDEGFEDLSVGAKVSLGDPGALRLGALVESSLPTGSGPFGADQAVASAGLLADWSPRGPFGMSANLGASRGLESGDESVTVVVTPALAAGDHLGLYGGWAGDFRPGVDLHWLEGGVTLLVGGDTQLDLNGGLELESETFFVGVGVARRLRR